MKTFLKSLVFAGLFSLTAAPVLATTLVLEPIFSSPATNWVASPNAMFSVRTMQTLSGQLIIHVNNLAGREINVTVWRADGTALLNTVLDRQPGHVIQLDAGGLQDDTYRIEVSNDSERVIKQVLVSTPVGLPRQSVVSVIGTSTRL